MIIYPYSSPIILKDSIFQDYGGDVANSTPDVRTWSYWTAEEAVSRDLNTFLLPTIVTGTYNYNHYVMLDHSYIQQIYAVRFIDSLNVAYHTVSGSFNTYARLQSDTYGVVDLDYIGSLCGSCQYGQYPYKVEIIYQAGLPTGTANLPSVLMALTQATTIFINEIQGWGNEGVGDIGITRFSNQQYSESRMALINTAYGNSAKAQFIHRRLDGLRKRRYVGI